MNISDDNIYIYGVKKIFEDEHSKSFTIAIINSKTGRIRFPIGIFNFPIDMKKSDKYLLTYLEDFLEQLSIFRQKRQEKIDIDFFNIVNKF